jgi:hypothetical protein
MGLEISYQNVTLREAVDLLIQGHERGRKVRLDADLQAVVIE